MQEVQDMLNRMVTLATQSANGTYDNETDRANLQKEVDALKSEINRIADSSNFNGINLLDGSLEENTVVMDPTTVSVTAIADGEHSPAAQSGVYTIDFSQFSVTNASTTAGTVSISIGGVAITGTASVGAGATITGDALVTALVAMTTVSIDGIDYALSKDGTSLKLEAKSAPTTDAAVDLDVAVSVSGITDYSQNQGEGIAVNVVTPAVKIGGNKMAQGSFALTSDIVKDGNVITIGTDSYTFRVGADSKIQGENVINLKDYEESDGTKLLLAAAQKLSQVDNSKFIIATGNTSNATIRLTEKEDQIDYATDWNLAGASATVTDADWSGIVTYGVRDETSTGGLQLQIGDTADSYNQLTVSISDIHTSALGIDDIDISTQAGAQSAIDAIKNAINQVSSTRGDLGAVQNRLEHTANNLSVMTENIQDAESTIRDTDIAEEMMSYTKNNILVQSAQAMLAQANTVPQGVLQLLQ
jgi:flagellin